MRPLLINGEWLTTSHASDNINPSDTSDVIDSFAQAGLAETQDAISAADAAFVSWSLTTPQTRHDILKTAGDEIMRRKDEIGELLSREEGKYAPKGSAKLSGPLRYFCSLLQKRCG